MHRKVAAAIIAALALGVASCGGSEKTTLDRGELVRRVELACREARSTMRERFRATRDSATSFRDGQRQLTDRLEELEASGSAKHDFNTYKDGVRIRLQAIEKVASAPRAKRESVIRSVQGKAEAAMRRGEAAASRIGIDGC
jgi:hypothetical protein